jgi:hypothetical protein
MSCPHCGADVPDGQRFCPACRKRVVAPSQGFDQTPPRSPPPARPIAAPPPPDVAPPTRHLSTASALAFGGTLDEIRRPGSVTGIAVWDFAQSLFFLLGAAVISLEPAEDDLVRTLRLAFLAVYLVLAAAHVVVGIGVLKMRSWARIAQIVLASIGLIGFPCGTILSIFILVYMLKPGVRILFSGRQGELTPEEAAQVGEALRSKAALWALGAVVGLLVLVFFIGIVAAIAIPSLLRARISANEAAALGRLRALIDAETTFASMSGGAYGAPSCLQAPASCVPGLEAGPSLLPERVVFDAPAAGYVLAFHPGPPPFGEGEAVGLHRTYAITALPATAQGGVRRFCADDSGVVFVLPQGAPAPSGGRCPDSGRPLR